MRILFIANYAEGVGGISVQVGLLKEKLAKDGHECRIVSTKGSVWKRLKALFWILFNGRKFDVFHIHACSGTGFFPAVVGVSTGRLLHRRTVLTYHGGGAEGYFKKRKSLVRHFMTRTGQNIVLSGFIGNVFDSFGLPYTIIPNVIELEGSRFRKRTSFKPEFISIRSLTATYNVECTLRAFKAVLQKYPESRLVLLGDGDLRMSLESLAAELGISEHVEFKGQVSNAEIYDYLDKTDIMVSSSRFDNMPVSILEGFNAGLLVIASKVGGVPFIIQDGDNGLLFEDGNYTELAGKMIYAIEHPAEVSAMAEAAYSSLVQYSWENCRDRLIRAYTGS